ncbi:uncharacterized protein LOC133202439, partial [Saccostrea echinata]|uniref:uncharacterized protein LOC133202439 n=1 Tax=Saccostrea echinata TaxID=191078 RepID=UPI002A802149
QDCSFIEKIMDVEEKHEHEEDTFNNNWRYVASLVAIILFLVSFDCDIILATEYHKREMYHEFNVTVSVMIAACLVTGCLSTYWLIQDGKLSRSPPGYFLCLLARFLIPGLSRDVDIVSKWFSKKIHTNQDIFLQAFIDARRLRLYDALIGTSTQFLLQGSYYIATRSESDIYLSSLRRMSIMWSYGVIMWSLMTYILSSAPEKASEERRASIIAILIDFFGRKTTVAVIICCHLVFALNYFFLSGLSNYHSTSV